MKKMVLIVLVVLIALVAVVGIGGAIYVDHLARAGIEQGASYATGVTTTLQAADVGITRGELTMQGLRLANPQGYAGDHFLDMKRGSVAVGLASLMEDQIEVPLVELTGLDMRIERADGKNNYDVILDNLKQLSGGDKPAQGGKGLIIRKLVIDQTTVTIAGFGVGEQSLTLPRIELTDVGSGDDRKGTGEVVGIVIRELLTSLLSDPTRLPDMLVGSLGEGLQGLGNLGQVGVQVIGNVADQAGKVVEGAGEAVQDVGKKFDEGLKGVGGLLDKDKTQDNQKDKDKETPKEQDK